MYIYKYFIVVFIDIPYILRSIAKWITRTTGST